MLNLLPPVITTRIHTKIKFYLCVCMLACRRGVFIACGALGIAFVCITTCARLFELEKPLAKDKIAQKSTSTSQTAMLDKDSPVFQPSADSGLSNSRIKKIIQILGLIQYHGVHGWIFFVILTWSPTLIHGSSGSVLTTGLLSSCPWISAALCSLLGTYCENIRSVCKFSLFFKTGHTTIANVVPCAQEAFLEKP